MPAVQTFMEFMQKMFLDKKLLDITKNNIIKQAIFTRLILGLTFLVF